jgi:hypothetical protein
MSLSNLKKSNSSKGKKKKFTVDEFINDAENYAKGQPKIVSPKQEQTQKLAAEQAITETRHIPKPIKTSKKLKHATFTLGDDIIELLNGLSKESGLAKSHILRILVAELSKQEQEKWLPYLLGSKIE